MRNYLLVILCLFLYFKSPGQTCSEDKVQVILSVQTDRFAENSWTLSSADSIYAKVDDSEYFQATTFVDTFCIGQSECLTLMAFDRFGDGILSGGGIKIYLGDSLALDENSFGLAATFEINCQAGTSCLQALEITEGTHTAPKRDSWYQFMPDTVGTYTISTCDMNECDTRIWVYDRCESYEPDNQEGFIFFDDNSGNCGFQAVVNAYFKAGQTYLIRISDTSDDCEGPINFS